MEQCGEESKVDEKTGRHEINRFCGEAVPELQACVCYVRGLKWNKFSMFHCFITQNTLNQVQVGYQIEVIREYF